MGVLLFLATAEQGVGPQEADALIGIRRDLKASISRWKTSHNNWTHFWMGVLSPEVSLFYSMIKKLRS